MASQLTNHYCTQHVAIVFTTGFVAYLGHGITDGVQRALYSLNRTCNVVWYGMVWYGMVWYGIAYRVKRTPFVSKPF